MYVYKKCLCTLSVESLGILTILKEIHVALKEDLYAQRGSICLIKILYYIVYEWQELFLNIINN